MKDNIPYKIYLSEAELPKQWYNVRADMKNKPAPLLNPGILSLKMKAVSFVKSLGNGLNIFPKNILIFISRLRMNWLL